MGPPLRSVSTLMGTLYLAESFVPAITFLWGRREKKIPEGTWEFIGTYRGIFEVSVRYVLQRAQAFPAGTFSARIPRPRPSDARDERLIDPPHHPGPWPDGGDLISQPNPHFRAKQLRKQPENQIPVLQGNAICIIMRRYFQKI